MKPLYGTARCNKVTSPPTLASSRHLSSQPPFFHCIAFLHCLFSIISHKKHMGCGRVYTVLSQPTATARGCGHRLDVISWTRMQQRSIANQALVTATRRGHCCQITLWTGAIGATRSLSAESKGMGRRERGHIPRTEY